MSLNHVRSVEVKLITSLVTQVTVIKTMPGLDARNAGPKGLSLVVSLAS